MQPQHQPANIERRTSPRYRVTVHLDGEAWLYETHKSNGAALDYQRHMVQIYRQAGLPVFVRKERL